PVFAAFCGPLPRATAPASTDALAQVLVASSASAIWAANRHRHPGAGHLVLSEQCPGRHNHVRLAGEGDLLEALVVWSRHFSGPDPRDRRVQVIEGLLVDACGDLRADAV